MDPSVGFDDRAACTRPPPALRAAFPKGKAFGLRAFPCAYAFCRPYEAFPIGDGGRAQRAAPLPRPGKRGSPVTNQLFPSARPGFAYQHMETLKLTEYSHMRTWIGHQLLAPSAFPDDYDRNTVYPLCFRADGAVALQDVMEIIRNRFEGTPYSPDETGRTDMRVIGTDTALSVHVAQIYPGLPAEMSCVTWESTGPAVYGVFVPVSNAALSVSEAYGRNQAAEDAFRFDTGLYPYYRFKELNTLCVEKNAYGIYGKPVRAFWHAAEAFMIQGMREVLSRAAAMEDTRAAAQLITDYCNALQEQAFEDAGLLLNDVRWMMSKNSNTLKNGRNPETHEVLDELKPVDPITVTPDPSVYGNIPAE